MATKAVERPAEAQLPALKATPALQFDASDLALPRIKIAQFSSKAVQKELVSAGSLYSAVGQDDAEPVVLGQPMRFHVIAFKRGKSFSEPGGELQRYDFNDPDAPDGAWVTYDYTMVLPEEDPSMPYKFLLTKTAVGAARQLNFALAKASQPHYELAFEFTTQQRENPKGRYYVPILKTVEATADGIAAATDMAITLGPDATASAGASATDQPDI